MSGERHDAWATAPPAAYDRAARAAPAPARPLARAALALALAAVVAASGCRRAEIDGDATSAPGESEAGAPGESEAGAPGDGTEGADGKARDRAEEGESEGRAEEDDPRGSGEPRSEALGEDDPPPPAGARQPPFAELASRAGASVVHLRAAAGTTVAGGPAEALGATGAERALGSGFAIGDRRHIVTADRVARLADAIEVVAPGGEALEAEILGRDARLGVAVLGIDGEAGISAASLGDSQGLEAGEWVVAVGDPLGDGTAAASAMISSPPRAGAERAPWTRGLLRLDRDVAAEAGGGPLVNRDGEVIGVALPGPEGAGGGRAAPISRVADILPLLLAYREGARAWLGLEVEPAPAERADDPDAGTPGAALVTDVAPGSPAERAGVRAGDIIVAVGDRRVDHEDLPHIIAAAEEGSPLELEILRDGEARELTATPAPHPE